MQNRHREPRIATRGSDRIEFVSAARRCPGWARLGHVLVLSFALVSSAPAHPGSSHPGDAAFEAGQPLTEALVELSRRGLELVFSSRVVDATWTVTRTPDASDLQEILHQLLAPHGLTVEEGPGNSLVVVSDPRAQLATLRGRVTSRPGGAALAAAQIWVAELDREIYTDLEGRFELADVPAGTYSVEARVPGYVVHREEAVELPRGTVSILLFALTPAPLAADEIVVHPSRLTLLQEEPSAPVALSREEILALPHLGDDTFRALGLLPGVTSSDVTAQFHVRGGRRDEVLILLDGQELYDAFHLEDFDNALSVVPSSGLGQVNLTTGAFPAAYGDRMGGVLDMSTLSPPRSSRRFRIALSLLNAQIEGAGGFADGRGGWMASLRQGTTDIAGRLLDREDPGFWDFFSKVDYRPTPRQSVRLHALVSDDSFDFTERNEDEDKRLDTRYQGSYLWATHQAILNDRLFVDTALSYTALDRDRRGRETDDERHFEVRDIRNSRITGVHQVWNLQAGQRHFLKAGVEVRRFESEFDYTSEWDFSTPLALTRSQTEEGEVEFRDRLISDHLAAYLTDRIRLGGPVTLELGARYDEHTLTRDSILSPRANLSWRLAERTVLRLGWGHYYQSQRPYELMIEDSDLSLYPAERSVHWVLGVEHFFAPEGPGLLAFRAEAYRREVRNPRPRYISRYEPFDAFPEGEFDRLRLEPEAAQAEGLELFLRGRGGPRFDWWLNYTYASTEDRLEGRDVPRLIDQPHALRVDFNYRLPRGWSLNLAWSFHSGWPTTAISLAEVTPPPGDQDQGEEDEESEDETLLIPVLGPLNAERLPDYHRLDLRASHARPLGRGTLTLFVDVQNLYHHQNVAGTDLEIDEDAAALVREDELWPGFFASLGASWSF